MVHCRRTERNPEQQGQEVGEGSSPLPCLRSIVEASHTWGRQASASSKLYPTVRWCLLWKRQVAFSLRYFPPHILEVIDTNDGVNEFPHASFVNSHCVIPSLPTEALLMMYLLWSYIWVHHKLLHSSMMDRLGQDSPSALSSGYSLTHKESEVNEESNSTLALPFYTRRLSPLLLCFQLIIENPLKRKAAILHSIHHLEFKLHDGKEYRL